MSIKVLNDQVAIKPIVFDHDKGGQKMVAGFYGTDKLAKSLVVSEVVFDSKTFQAGQKVYLRAEIYNTPQAKNLMKLDGSEFILILESMVVAAEQK